MTPTPTPFRTCSFSRIIRRMSVNTVLVSTACAIALSSTLAAAAQAAWPVSESIVSSAVSMDHVDVARPNPQPRVTITGGDYTTTFAVDVTCSLAQAGRVSDLFVDAALEGNEGVVICLDGSIETEFTGTGTIWLHFQTDSLQYTVEFSTENAMDAADAIDDATS